MQTRHQRSQLIAFEFPAFAQLIALQSATAALVGF